MELSKVLSIWDDLEKSYIRLKDHVGANSKIEFFHIICGYNKEEGKTKLIQLRARMHSESREYTPIETSKYNELLKLFDHIEQNIKDITAVSNLNNLKSKLLSSKAVTITVREVNQILGSTISRTKVLPYTTFYSNYKQFDRVIASIGSRAEVLVMKRADVFKFESKQEVISANKNRDRQSDFVKACIDCAMLVDKKYINNTLYLHKDKAVESIKLVKTSYKFGEEYNIPNSKFKAREAIIKNTTSIVTCRIIEIFE